MKLKLKFVAQTICVQAKRAMAEKDFLLFLAVSFISSSLIPPVAYGNSDSEALSALRNSLIDPHNVLSSWDTTLVDPCTWFHVICNDDNRVIRLDLGHENMFGTLVPELGKLDQLQYLGLYKNNIQGTIPPELGNLTRLKELDLSHNYMEGTIPPSLGNLQSLVFLRLNDNLLSGSFPKEIANIPTLKVVDISHNLFSNPKSAAGLFKHIS